MSVLCPCCDRPMDAPHAPLSALKDAPFTVQRRMIVDVLADAYPRSVDLPFLIDAVYFHDPEGGAETAPNVIRTQLTRIRHQLAQYGWTIPCAARGRGYHARYRLEPLNAERPAA